VIGCAVQVHRPACTAVQYGEIKTMHTIPSLLLCFLALAAPIHAQQSELEKETEALLVRHIPNPVDGYYSKELGIFKEFGLFKWDYKTEVQNNLDVPLQITHFGFYYYETGKWILANFNNRLFTSADFTERYIAGDSIVDGWIPPGKVAIRAENWNRWNSVPPPVKWAYDAVDSQGNKYYAEEEIQLNPAPVPILDGSIVYPKFYKFHAGDDTTWAQPELDDSDWLQMRYGTFPTDKWQGIGWLRFIVEVDSSLWHQPLGLHIGSIFGAVEFYLDGKLVHHVGSIAASKEEEDARIMWDPVPISFHPPPGHVGRRSKHLVALRHSSFFWDSPIWSGQRWSIGWHIGDLREMSADRVKTTRKVTFHQMFLMGILLAFALLHLLLFLFYPSRSGRTNLYFAAFTTFFALMVYFNFQHLFTIDAKQFFLHKNLLSISATLALLFGIRFTYLLIYPRLPKIFIIFCLVGFSLTLWHSFRPFIMEKYVLVFYIACSVEVIRVLAITRIKKRETQIEGGWIILLGWMPLALVGGYYFLATDALHLVPIPWDFEDFPAPYYASLLLVISMSVFLARNFAQTTINLEAKLVEVKELSEKTLQQERERSRLEAENARKTQELEEARRLQLSMLPQTVPQLPNLEIAVYSKPATEVGGDYYDFHLDGDDTLTIAIGDATGHGMNAGTMVSVVKGLFQSLAPQPSIPKTFKEISGTLVKMNLGLLFMAITLVKFKENRIKISAAGMPPALHYKAAKDKVDEILLKGLPLGGFPDFVYQERVIDLNAGDALILMSDGLPERFNDAGEMLDYPGARRLVEEVAHQSPQAIIDSLVRAGDKWSNGRPQDDDVTFVVMKMK